MAPSPEWLLKEQRSWQRLADAIAQSLTATPQET